jgi:hypothetical protein
MGAGAGSRTPRTTARSPTSAIPTPTPALVDLNHRPPPCKGQAAQRRGTRGYSSVASAGDRARIAESQPSPSALMTDAYP